MVLVLEALRLTSQIQLTNGGKLLSADADHGQLVDLASPAQIEHGQANNADFLVRAGSPTTDKTGGVLARAHL